MDVRAVFKELHPSDWVFLLFAAYLIGQVWDLSLFALASHWIRSLLLAVLYYFIARRSPNPIGALAWSLLISLGAIVVGPLIL